MVPLFIHKHPRGSHKHAIRQLRQLPRRTRLQINLHHYVFVRSFLDLIGPESGDLLGKGQDSLVFQEDSLPPLMLA